MANEPRFLGQSPIPVAENPRWLWPVNLFLIVLLAAQCLVADRTRLARQDRTRPLVVSACRVLGCSLPDLDAPGTFHLLSNDVHADPDHANALRVRGSFRNDAGWAQSWPVITLVLSDLDGHPVARGRFLPADYLAGSSHAARIGPGETAAFQLNVTDPSSNAVSFEFGFETAVACASETAPSR